MSISEVPVSLYKLLVANIKGKIRVCISPKKHLTILLIHNYSDADSFRGVPDDSNPGTVVLHGNPQSSYKKLAQNSDRLSRGLL